MGNHQTASRIARWVFGLGILPVLATACDSPTDTAGGRTTVSVFLKDGPGDVDSVWVQIDDIMLMGDSGSVSVLNGPTGLVNVTALRDSTTLLVDGMDVPAGHYQEVRFVLGGAVLQAGADVYTFGGAEHPAGLAATGTLQCPSCAQSGVKVKLADGIDFEEGENAFLLDFDVSQSFGHLAGHSGKWVMHPVIHGTVTDPDEAENDDAGGEIEGMVVLGVDGDDNPITIPMCGGEERSLASFLPEATATTLLDDEGVPLMFVGHVEDDDDGTFEFEIRTLDFDTFVLGYESQTDFDAERLVWTATVDPASVVLTADADHAEGVTYTITAVSCEPLTP